TFYGFYVPLLWLQGSEARDASSTAACEPCQEEGQSVSFEVASATLARWADHPDQFVRELFGATPDPWQDEALKAFPHSPRIAMKASKGRGKTCLEVWLAWNFLLPRPHPNIAATSVSSDNLRDNLWKECAVWRNKSPLL